MSENKKIEEERKFLEMSKRISEITDESEKKITELSELVMLDLIKAIKCNCSTYCEVSKVLRVRKQDARWTGNQLMIQLLEVVEEYFEKEKNTLPLVMIKSKSQEAGGN